MYISIKIANMAILNKKPVTKPDKYSLRSSGCFHAKTINAPILANKNPSHAPRDFSDANDG